METQQKEALQVKRGDYVEIDVPAAGEDEHWRNIRAKILKIVGEVVTYRDLKTGDAHHTCAVAEIKRVLTGWEASNADLADVCWADMEALEEEEFMSSPENPFNEAGGLDFHQGQ